MSETETNGNLEQLADRLRTLAENVRRQLGCGFGESILQNAFAVELRDAKIEYLKEVNIEIFYRAQYVGTGRPDFVLTKVGDHAESIIVELKQAQENSTNADHRAQLKAYCTSFPLNHNPVLTNFTGGILLTFPKSDLKHTAAVHLSIVDKTSRIIKDETNDAKLQKAKAKAEAAKRKAEAKQEDDRRKAEAKHAKAAAKLSKTTRS